MKKYCEKCTYHENLFVDGGYGYESRCKYMLNEDPYDTFLERKYQRSHPIPSIHNANNDCPYYKENWLLKILRRLKNDADGKN